MEHFTLQKTDEVIRHWGSIEKFDHFIQKVREDESNVAQLAIRQFGSIENYTKAMKNNLEHFSELMEQADELAKHKDEILEKNEDLYHRLTADLTKDIASPEIQDIIQNIVEDCQENALGIDMGEGFWDMVIEGYSAESVKEVTDQKYGTGASEYMAKALRYYFQK